MYKCAKWQSGRRPSLSVPRCSPIAANRRPIARPTAFCYCHACLPLRVLSPRGVFLVLLPPDRRCRILALSKQRQPLWSCSQKLRASSGRRSVICGRRNDSLTSAARAHKSSSAPGVAERQGRLAQRQTRSPASMPLLMRRSDRAKQQQAPKTSSRRRRSLESGRPPTEGWEETNRQSESGSRQCKSSLDKTRTRVENAWHDGTRIAVDDH